MVLKSTKEVHHALEGELDVDKVERCQGSSSRLNEMTEEADREEAQSPGNTRDVDSQLTRRNLFENCCGRSGHRNDAPIRVRKTPILGLACGDGTDDTGG